MLEGNFSGRVRHAGVAAILVVTLTWLACDDEPTGPNPDERLVLQKITEVAVPRLPTGLVVSDDGRWLVILSHGERLATLLDAGTYNQLGQATDIGDPNGVAFSNEGTLAVVGSTFSGTLGFDVPSMERRFLAPFSGRYVLHDPRDDSFYVAGAQFDVVRISGEGEITARFEAEGPRGIALSNDRNQVFFLSGFPESKVFALETPTLQKASEASLPFVGTLVIPLESSHEVLIVGSMERTISPVMTVTFDPQTGEVGQPRTVTEGSFVLDFGSGSPWVSIDHNVLIPSTIGVLVIDQGSRELQAVLGPADFENSPPCCDVVLDTTRDRLIFSSFVDVAAPQGLLEVFEVEE